MDRFRNPFGLFAPAALFLASVPVLTASSTTDLQTIFADPVFNLK